MGNPFGRSTIIALTNKSGGAVAVGDVVIVDSGNNDAFTTTTTAGYTKGIGIAQQAIANNATGLVLIDGYAALVNVNASVSRGNFLKTHTVAKQGTDAGSSRGAGTCGIFLTGGTTPDAIIWQPDLGAGSGEVVTTAAIWDAAGDLAQGTGADTAAKLSAGTAGQFLMANGSSSALSWASREIDYVQFTSSVNITNTVEASADTVVTANALSGDGSTVYIIEFFCPRVRVPAGNHNVNFWLFDGSTSQGFLGILTGPDASNEMRVPTLLRRRLTPSNASHTYSIRATVDSGTGVADAGAGGTGAVMPGYIRIERAK